MEIYTLENAIYLGMKNDVSFILDSGLNLYEHQASYNPNMPLRDLLYIARQLQKYVKDKSLYSSSIVKIPAPRFVVFYNGTISVQGGTRSKKGEFVLLLRYFHSAYVSVRVIQVHCRSTNSSFFDSSTPTVEICPLFEADE